MALERGSGKLLFLKQKGRTPPVQPIARSRALLTPRPKRALGKPFLIKEYHKLRKNNKNQRDRCFAARMRLQGKIKGACSMAAFRDIKTEPRVVGGGSDLIDSTAPPIRSSSYSISQLSEESNPEAAFLVSLLQKELKNFTLEKRDGLW